IQCDQPTMDAETKVRLRADLDRYMQAASLAEMRDVAAANPLLLGSYVADYLTEAAKRLRQLGETHTAESCEFRLDILRKFREFGVQEGYLELAIDELVRAQTPEQHQQVLTDYPELASEAAATYMKRRLNESVQMADTGAQSRYRFALTMASTT